MQTANGVSHPANTFPPNGPSAGAPNGVPASRLEQLQARPQQLASPPNGPAVVQVVSAPAAPRPPMFGGGGGGGFYLSNSGQVIAAPAPAPVPVPAPAAPMMVQPRPAAPAPMPMVPGSMMAIQSHSAAPSPMMVQAQPRPAPPAMPVAYQAHPRLAPMPVQAPNPPAGGGNIVHLDVVVPHGAVPGQQLEVQGPGGGRFRVVIPMGVGPGQRFRVQMPRPAASKAMAMGLQHYLPRPAPPPPRPRPPPINQNPATQVSIVLEATHGLRSEGSLVLDKRQVTLHVSVLDADSKLTSSPLGLEVKLVYEDLQPMLPEVQLAALTGKTTFSCPGGTAVVRLRITTVSSHHNKRRFRFKVGPLDASLAQEQPKLIQLSEAFTVINHTQHGTNKPPKPAPAPKPDVPQMARPGAVPAAAPGSSAPNGAAVSGGAPQLTRHRYFSAAELRAATDALPARDGPPLTRKALGLSDRLAALVAQQVTQRAWQQARRRPLREGDERVLRGRDVAAAVRRPGQLDFLFHACLLRRWAAAEEAVPGEPEAPPLLWGPAPDWHALAASQQPPPQPQPAGSPAQPPLAGLVAAAAAAAAATAAAAAAMGAATPAAAPPPAQPETPQPAAPPLAAHPAAQDEQVASTPSTEDADEPAAREPMALDTVA